jgi:hypothetical protein
VTGRPEKPLDLSTGPVAQFAASLRRLRHEMGSPTYRTMSSRTNYSVSALSIAAGGTRFPSWDCTEAYIRACGVRDEDLLHWRRRWRAADRKIRAEKNAAKARSKARSSAVAEAEAEAYKLFMEVSAEMPATMVKLPSLPVLGVRYVDANPAELATLEEFLIALDQIRVEKGLSLRQIADRSRRTSLPGTSVSGGLSRSQLHDMLNSRAPLRSRHVHAYLLACGVSQNRAAEWLARLYKLQDQDRRARAALAALKARHDETVTMTTTRTRTITQVPHTPVKTPQPATEAPAQEPNPEARGRHRRPNPLARLLRLRFGRTAGDEAVLA